MYQVLVVCFLISFSRHANILWPREGNAMQQCAISSEDTQKGTPVLHRHNKNTHHAAATLHPPTNKPHQP